MALYRPDLSGRIIASAIEVHRILGPGLLESAYRACLAHEIRSRGLLVETEVPVAITYKALRIPAGFRVDLLVEQAVIVELKAVETLLPVHDAQLLTYLKLCNLKVGLLLNFNAKNLRTGLRRLVR